MCKQEYANYLDVTINMDWDIILVPVNIYGYDVLMYKQNKFKVF